MIMLRNENRLALSLLATITAKAMRLNYLSEDDFYMKSEEEIISVFDRINNRDFQKHYKTFKTMKEIVRSEKPIDKSYSVSVDVKKRFINPMCKDKRLSEISQRAEENIEYLLKFRDTLYACVPFV